VEQGVVHSDRAWSGDQKENCWGGAVVAAVNWKAVAPSWVSGAMLESSSWSTHHNTIIASIKYTSLKQEICSYKQVCAS